MSTFYRHLFLQYCLQAKRGVFFLLLLGCNLLCLINESVAQKFPEGFSQMLVAQNLSNPTVMAFAPDGRIFVGEQNGRLRIIKNGTLLASPFVALQVNASGERGLIGVALDPNFSSNGYVYVYYTLANAKNNRISRFTASGDLAQPGSERVILDLDPLSSATNHNGGAMQFGKDGKLYVAVGENANSSYSQNLDTYHGKILRINSDGSVPVDNPFAAGSEKKRRIWAYGFRNPYTFDVHPTSGRIFVNDVGQNTWEEINNVSAGGGNYGWPRVEGRGNQTAYVNPVYAYLNENKGGNDIGCAIAGGTFFRPASTTYPQEYAGKYFFQDYCNGWIRTINVDGGASSLFASGLGNTSLSVTTGNDGNLYYINRANGSLYKIVYNRNSTAPVITGHPVNATVTTGQNVTFNVSASGSGKLTYQWQKNGTNINGAKAATFTVAAVTPASAGQYRVIVSNQWGSTTSKAATLIVQATNKAPVAVILTPAAGSLYKAGATINFSGSATDTKDGNLPGSTFKWEVVFHHNTHSHDGPPVAMGVKNGSFVIPNRGETESDVWYRLYLTVTDSDGISHKVYRDIYPYKSTMSFATEPAGLQINLDGKLVKSPLSVRSVVGLLRSVNTDATQTLNNAIYEFSHWKHGGSKEQTIATPQVNTTYTAVFKQKSSNNLRNPENPANTVSGINYQYYEGNWTSLPDFSTITPVKKGNVENFNLSQRKRDTNFAFRFKGFVQIPKDGTYTFYTNSDDGSQLYIGNTLVVDNNGMHTDIEKSGSIGLKSGKHTITFTFFEVAGFEILNVGYAGPDLSKRTIPAYALSRVVENTSDIFSVKVNFQPESSQVPVGYVADYGNIFGKQNGNLSYGWNAPTIETRDRDNSSDLRYGTLNHMQKPSNPNAVWEIALPNGNYQVKLASSDPLHRNQINNLSVEGTVVSDPDGYDNLDEYSTTVAVMDGRLTIKPATGSSNAKISFVDISQVTNTNTRLSVEDPVIADVNLFPNPAKDYVVIQVTAEQDEVLYIAITDVVSHQLISTTHKAVAGENSIKIATGQLAGGTYLLTILSGNKQLTKRLIISR